ncbi:alpha/beta fold hydrolase [Sphingomonas bacterium]|uniref:alpha/beta fold hydrolase n=1 Tax=Sphingomonas bacterium TaxID=1895847 RepID=UPI00157723C2|nr:alpha/beta hydrolase [Sphingomonas bacterium]
MSTIDPSEPAVCTYASQGLTLSYCDWGNAGAPMLLLLHGSRDHARSWDWTARALRDRFHVVAPDLRGHGDSAWSPDGAYLLAYYLIDLIELIDRLGAPRLSIVGHSLGGNVVARCAALLPDRFEKVVIVDGLGPNEALMRAWEEAGPLARTRDWITSRRDPRLARPRRFATLADATARMAEANPHLSPEQARHLALHGVRRHADGYGWKYDPRVGLFAPEDFALDVRAFWKAIEAPTLLCYGPESWTTNPAADGREANFRDARTEVFENAGHWLHHDRFDAFLAALEAFL